MKCPHCLNGIHESWATTPFGVDVEAHLTIENMVCPECGRRIFRLARQPITGTAIFRTFLYPRATTRPVPTEVPDPYRTDYTEAASVLADSPKASAAVSRRTLQNILRDIARVKQTDLSSEIEEVLGRGNLPSQLAEAIDAVRQVGNFAAHPIKSTTSGAVVEVEPGEAEWLLDVLDAAFDFYFVQPAILKRKRDELNKKLADAGKPPLR